MTKCSCGAMYQNGSGRRKRCDACTEAHLGKYQKEYQKEYQQGYRTSPNGIATHIAYELRLMREGR